MPLSIISTISITSESFLWRWTGVRTTPVVLHIVLHIEHHIVLQHMVGWMVAFSTPHTYTNTSHVSQAGFVATLPNPPASLWTWHWLWYWLQPGHCQNPHLVLYILEQQMLYQGPKTSLTSNDSCGTSPRIWALCGAHSFPALGFHWPLPACI